MANEDPLAGSWRCHPGLLPPHVIPSLAFQPLPAAAHPCLAPGSSLWRHLASEAVRGHRPCAQQWQAFTGLWGNT